MYQIANGSYEHNVMLFSKIKSLKLRMGGELMDYISHCCIIEELRSSQKSIISDRSQPWYEILLQTCKEDVKSASREVVDRFKALYPSLTVVHADLPPMTSLRKLRSITADVMGLKFCLFAP